MVVHLIDVLIEVEDVTPVFVDEFRDQRNEAGLVRAMNQKNRAVGQRWMGVIMAGEDKPVIAYRR